MDKLLLVDGNAVLHRAYYALPDWRNRSGEATAGVYGFLSMLLRAIDDLKPTHLAVVFDTPQPTFRHQMYVGYQTNREKERQVSEDIWGQVEKLKIVFDKMGVPVLAVPGFEADDVIGTVAGQAVNNTSSPDSEEGRNKSEVVIITGDKDLMQLVNDRVRLYMPRRGLADSVLVDREKVKEKMGVGPEQIVDYKALVGDASDNYPGVSGIGPKTAVDLLEKFGSFEKVYKDLIPLRSHPGQIDSSLASPLAPLLSVGEGNIKRKISEPVMRKLIEGYEGGELSRKLATIKLDVPVTIHTEEAKVPGQEKILAVLKELGYKSLIKRITGEKPEQEKSQIGLFD